MIKKEKERFIETLNKSILRDMKKQEIIKEKIVELEVERDKLRKQLQGGKK